MKNSLIKFSIPFVLFFLAAGCNNKKYDDKPLRNEIKTLNSEIAELKDKDLKLWHQLSGVYGMHGETLRIKTLEDLNKHLTDNPEVGVRIVNRALIYRFLTYEIESHQGYSPKVINMFDDPECINKNLRNHEYFKENKILANTLAGNLLEEIIITKWTSRKNTVDFNIILVFTEDGFKIEVNMDTSVAFHCLKTIDSYNEKMISTN